MQPENLFEPATGAKPNSFILVTSKWTAIDTEDLKFVSTLGLSIVVRDSLEHVYINTQPYYKQPLHRVLLGVTNPEVIVDHKNHNGLDNRRFNLRCTNKVGNALNMKVNKNKRSGLPKGVYKKGDKFKAVITVNGMEFYLGAYSSVEMAEAIYNKANNNYWAGKKIRDGII